MSTHTPAPWELERDPSHYNSLSTIVGGEKSSKCHGRQMIVNVGGFANLDEQEANARLIACAPELLEALKVTTSLCRLKYGNLDAEVYNEILRIESIIAKAEGRV